MKRSSDALTQLHEYSRQYTCSRKKEKESRNLPCKVNLLLNRVKCPRPPKTPNLRADCLARTITSAMTLKAREANVQCLTQFNINKPSSFRLVATSSLYIKTSCSDCFWVAQRHPCGC